MSGERSVVQPVRDSWGSRDLTTFGAKLREERLARGLSQAALGQGRFSASYISHLERGTRNPTEEALSFLAEQLGVTYHTLLDDGEEATPDEIAQTVAQILLEDSLVRHEYSEEVAVKAGLACASLHQVLRARRSTHGEPWSSCSRMPDQKKNSLNGSMS